MRTFVLLGVAAGSLLLAGRAHAEAPMIDASAATDLVSGVSYNHDPRPALDYGAIGGLSREMVERLTKARPETLGQAGRIDGVTPAALTAIMVHSRRRAA